MKLRITTESGSVYRLDTKAKVMLREPAEGATPLSEDNEPIRYERVWNLPDGGLGILWLKDGAPKLRTTTPVVETWEVQLDDSA